MDSLESDENGHLSNGMAVVHLLPSDDSASCDLFPEQEIFPRIGDNYQVEIPELLEMSEYLSISKNAENSENGSNVCYVGLPMPVLPISHEHGSTRVETTMVHQTLNLQSEERCQNENSNVDPLNVKFPNAPVVGSGDLNFSFVTLSATGCWTELEKSSFLLALYIFEKNFVLLERLVETKKLGEILTYYYGKFYRSHEYCRWSEPRKMRSRRCAFGQKIFNGPRQQEFLSRLIPKVSEECKNALLEVSKTFGEGKMSLEDYVFSLKARVGISMLVEVIGIGKGKQDLTSMALEPLRSNHSNQVRPEIPTGKACSNLTPSEIVKFLTGDYRLSKARSNDLFWEAAWPRLLARGWHSEEPKDQNYAATSKNSLVFLVSGIKKFSRRRLVKGIHYFDSVTDVLSKVASEPGLLELDTEEDGSKMNKEESKGNDNRMLEEDGMPTRRRHSYLQPRTPNRGTSGIKFTVVDTSLGGEEHFKLKELRLLPFEYSNKLNPGNLFELREEDTPEVSTEESDAVDTAFQNKCESGLPNASNDLLDGEIISDSKGLPNSAPKMDNYNSYPDSDSLVVNDSTRKPFLEEKQPKTRVKKRRVTQRTKEDNVQDMGPVNNRARRLTVCNQLETSNVIVNPANISASDPEPTQAMDVCNISDDILPQVASYDNKLSLSSSKGSPAESVACSSVNYHVVSEPQERSQNLLLIDLNLPQVPTDFETDVLMVDATGRNDDKSQNPGCDDALATPALEVVSLEQQQTNTNQQRRGTRNRPPTSRALEALANGFLTASSRRKDKGASSRARSRPSRRAHGTAGPGVAMQSHPETTIENVEPRTELSTTSVDSALRGQNVAGSEGAQVVFSEFEVLSPQNGAPSSGN